MNAESPRCCHCGQPVRFLFVNGAIRPFHKSGIVCGGAKRRSRKEDASGCLPFPVIFPPAFDIPVKQDICPCANKSILVVRHRDGFLTFDRLEWPWQRHVCARTIVADYGVEHLRQRLAGMDNLRPSLALVAGAQKGWGASPVHVVAVQELAEGGARSCLRLRGEDLPLALKRQERIEAGALVGLRRNGEVRQLITTSGFEFVCLDSRVWPEELGIPIEWIDPHSTQI